MMKVISAPSGLKWAVSAVFLTVPIAALQTIVTTRAPWWALPLRSMELSGLWAFGISVFVAAALLKGFRSFYWVLVGIGALWVILTAWVAIRTQNPGLGFFAIFLGVYFGLLTSWVKHEFGRSFFDPSMEWFEGSPRSIPSLDCEVQSGDDKSQMKVSRLDEEGAFLFLVKRKKDSLIKKIGFRNKKSELVFRFRNREVRCQGVPMLLFKRNSEGVGFRFEGNTPDQRKELGDFIETLRGEGYV